MAKRLLTVESLLRRRAAWLRANGYGGELHGQEGVPVGRRRPAPGAGTPFGEPDALTPERLAASLSVENFPYPDDPTILAALIKFRHLRQGARISAARRALS